MILRRIARPMLAAAFVSGGIDTLRNPKPRVDTAAPVLEKASEQADAELLVKVNAVAQVAAGTALGLGKFPRLSALVLAGSLAPTTAVGHRFWEKDGADRGAQRTHFLKNLSLLGGLLIAAADTHGKPSLAWRAKHTAATSAGVKLGGAAGAVQGTVSGAADAVQGAVDGATKSVRGTAKGATKAVRGTAKGATRSVKNTTKALKKKVA